MGAPPVCRGTEWTPGWDPRIFLICLLICLLFPTFGPDGSRDEDLDALVGVAGAGAFSEVAPCIFDGRA